MTGAGLAAVGSILVQRDAAWVRTATPDDVFAAHEGGELAELIAARNSPEAMPMVATPRGRQTSADQIEAARHAGELDVLGVVRNEEEDI